MRRYLGHFLTASGYVGWTGLSLMLLAPGISFMVTRWLVSVEVVSREAASSSLAQLIFYAATYTLALGIVLLPMYAWYRRDSLTKLLGIDRPLKWGSLLLLPLAFAAYFVLSYLLGHIVPLVIDYDVSQMQQVGFRGIDTVGEYVAAGLALVVIAPLAEELMFRGFLYGKLRQLMGVATATIIVSVLFGIAHGQWNVGIDVAALSVVLCLLREHTGSVWLGVCLHAAKNLLAFVLLFILKVQ